MYGSIPAKMRTIDDEGDFDSDKDEQLVTKCKVSLAMSVFIMTDVRINTSQDAYYR